MALTIGELTGFITLTDKGFGSAIQAAGKDLGKLQSTTSTTTARIESTVEQAFREVAEDIARGVDPAEALAGLDRLTGAFGSAMGELETSARTGGSNAASALGEALRGMESDARTAASGAANAVEQELSSLDGELRAAGKDAGDALVDGLRSGTDGAREAGRKAGQDAAEGVRQGGQGGMGGVGTAMIGALKAAPWVAAGTAIAGMVADAMRKALEREELFAGLAVKVGAFGQESERLGKLAGELYTQAYGKSLDEVTEALAKVIQNIDGARSASDKALGDMTKQALTTAKVMDENVGAVTRAVSNILRNELAPNAEAAFDVLIRGQQEGVNKSEDLLDTFNEYSTIFRDLGLSAQDALSLLSQGLRAGARDSDTVADALKELDIRVKDLSAKDALKELGLDANKMAQAFAKGGPKAREALDKILDALRKVEDPAERSQLAVELFGTKAEDMAKAISGLNLDTASKEIGKFKNAVQEADKAFQDTSANRVEEWKRAWEDVWAWLGDKLTEQAMQIFPDPKKEWETFSGFFTETVPNFFSDLWNDVSQATSDAWNGIGDWLSEKANAIVEWLKAVPTRVGEFFSTGWEKINTVAGTAWEAIKSAIAQKADAIVNWLKEAPGKIGGFLATGWDSIRSTAAEKWENIKTAISEKAGAAIEWLKKFPDRVKEVFSDVGTWLLQAGRDLIQGLINGIKEWAGKAAEAAKEVVNGAINAAKQALGISSPSRVARDEIGAPIMQGVRDGILLVEPEVTEVASSAILKAVDAAKKPVAPDAPGTKPAGYGIVEGAVKGIKEKEKDLTGQITATITKTMGTAEKTAKSGQSTKPAGYAVVEGVIGGVKAKEKDLVASVGKVIEAAVKEAQKGAAKVKAELDKAVKPAAPGAPPASAPKPDPVLSSNLDLTRAGPGTIAPSSSGGVTVNITNATVREEADLSRIGSQVAYMVMARG